MSLTLKQTSESRRVSWGFCYA